MMLESNLSAESAATPVETQKKVEGNWSQDSIVAELTRRLAVSDAELRILHREKTAMESKNSNMKGSSIELEKAYQSLMTHLGEREDEFRAVAQKNEHLLKRQLELEKITRELHSTMKFQRSLMLEKNDKLAELQKQVALKDDSNTKEVDELRLQLKVALDSQRAAVLEKNTLLEKLNTAEKTMKLMQADIDQHVEWQNETMEKATEQEKVISERNAKISKLAAKINELIDEITHQRELVKEAETHGKQKDSMLESAQDEITSLHARIEELDEETEKQKRIINVFEQRFVTKVQNILELNARVQNADKLWAKIEEREKKFTMKECTNHLLREENDNLRVAEKKLKSEIDELNGAFMQYKLHFAKNGERVDMAYFLSKLRETVKLNNRIDQLEKIIDEKGYIADVYNAACELREKERTVVQGIDAVGQVLSMLKSVLNEEEVEASRVIGKLEESLLLWQEKTIVPQKMKSDFDWNQNHEHTNSKVDLEIDVTGQDSHENTADAYDDDDNSDDITLNTAGFSVTKYHDDARCVDFRTLANYKNGDKIVEVVKHMQDGLKSIHKEGMSIASDVNEFIAQEIQEMALKLDKRDDREVKARYGSSLRRG